MEFDLDEVGMISGVSCNAALFLSTETNKYHIILWFKYMRAVKYTNTMKTTDAMCPKLYPPKLLVFLEQRKMSNIHMR